MLEQYDFLKWCIIFSGIYAFIWEILEGIRIRKLDGTIPGIKVGFAIIILYWTLYYIWSIYRDYNSIIVGPTHQVLIRGPLLITIVLIGTSASMSWFRHKGRK